MRFPGVSPRSSRTPRRRLASRARRARSRSVDGPPLRPSTPRRRTTFPCNPHVVKRGDAFGSMLLDHLEGKEDVHEIVERDDGFVDARLLPFERVDASLGRFDTVVMFGNNFGLVGGEAKGRRMLRRLRRLADRIVATSNDPYATEDPVHVAYHERNRRGGRMAGQVRIRVRYRELATPWFDYLLASPDEMAALAESGGWRVGRVLRGDGPYYVGVLD